MAHTAEEVPPCPQDESIKEKLWNGSAASWCLNSTVSCKSKPFVKYLYEESFLPYSSPCAPHSVCTCCWRCLYSNIHVFTCCMYSPKKTLKVEPDDTNLTLPAKIELYVLYFNKPPIPRVFLTPNVSSLDQQIRRKATLMKTCLHHLSTWLAR